MRINLPLPPFEMDSFATVFGFAVPRPFVDALNAICYDCTRPGPAYERVDQVLGWLLAGPEQRYHGTPPELFPIAATGVGGGHFGYVIHAPELVAADYPLARYEPSDSDPLRRVGRTTAEAISNTFSDHLFPEWQPRDEWPAPPAPEIMMRLAALSIAPDEARAWSRSEDTGRLDHVPPTSVPDGWLYVRSSDGVGVLASTNAFDPAAAHEMIDWPDINGCIAEGQKALDAGHAATALWHAREGLKRACWSPTDENIVLSQIAIAAYRALGREGLAAVVIERLRRTLRDRTDLDPALRRQLGYEPPWATREELQAALAEAGLGRWAQPLAELARPTIILERGPVTEGNATPLGTSRIGGMPDMPSGMPWPSRPPLADPSQGVYADHAARPWPLSFIAQIDFAEIEAAGGLDGFPASGRLLFFCDPIDYPWGHGAEDQTRTRVIFTDAPVTDLERRGYPSEFSMPEHGILEPRHFVFRARRLTPQRWLLPPYEHSSDIDRLRAEAPEDWQWHSPPKSKGFAYDAYERFWADLTRRFPTQFGKPGWPCIHQVGGSAFSIQDSVEADCVKYADDDHNSLAHYRAWMDKPRRNRPAVGSPVHTAGFEAFQAVEAQRQTSYVARADDWQLLLQIDSDDEAGMQWGDLGRLYVAIRKADLAAGRFDRTWTMLQCS